MVDIICDILNREVMFMKKILLAGLVCLLLLTACRSRETPPVDTDDLSHLRTPYVGAAHATHSVVNALPLPGENWSVASIQIGQDHGDFAERYSPYTLTIFYEPRPDSFIAGTRDNLQIPTEAFTANSDLLFDLIENLQAVTFSVIFTIAGDVDNDFFDYRWSRSRHGEYSLLTGNGNRRPETAALEVFIDLRGNVDLDFHTLHEVNYNDAFEEIRGFRFDGEGELLIMWANQPITYLSLIGIGDDLTYDELRLYVDAVIPVIEKLDLAGALVINSYYGMGTFPRSGVSFVDMTGVVRYFTLQESHHDGDDRFRLLEFRPTSVLNDFPS